MKYLKIFSIIVLFFASASSLEAKKYYTIVLATGHYNLEGFEFVKNEADKLTGGLKKYSRIILDDDYYILYALLSEKKSDALKILPKYKRLFKDAYIKKHDPSKVKTVIDFALSQNIDTKQTIKAPKKQRNLLFTNDMLIDRTIYALYINKDHKENIALIALELHDDFTMHFRVLIGEEYAGKGKYFVDFQGRFYVYSNEKQRYKDFYLLKEKNRDFMIVEAWENGKKTDNLVRFFYSLAKAQRYIDLSL